MIPQLFSCASVGTVAISSRTRDIEEMMKERGLNVDHSTVFRWVQRYAPEINKRIRPYLKMSGTSYRVDETYIKVGKSCKYLYRAVDKEGNTIEFMQERETRYFGSKTLLQEDDESRSSEAAVDDLSR